jgi:hypothetical protein
VNGRNALSLVFLTPAVKSNAGTTNSGFAERGPNLSALSINGGANSMNEMLLDGASNIQPYQGEVNVNVAVDAVQEFKVQSGTMSAEFGHTSGGVINIITKSGTNSLHGTAYEFLRNDKLDARNAFATLTPPLRYNQYGFSVGGPVIRDRTFVFANWEQYKYIKAFPLIGTMPTALQRTGNFSDLRGTSGALIPIFDPRTTRPNPSGSGFVRDAFPGNVIPTNSLDPVALKYQELFVPLPNRTPSDPFTNSNNYERLSTGKRNMNQLSIKGDHRFRQNNNAFVRYTRYIWTTDISTDLPSIYPDPVVSKTKAWDVKNYNIVAADTHTFSPMLINEVRISLARGLFPFSVASAGGGWPQKIGLPANYPPDTMPVFNNGLPGILCCTDGLRGQTGWAFVDTVTKIKGSHTLKFGYDHRLNRGNSFQKAFPSGSLNFAGGLTGNPQSPAGTGSSYATFLAGAVSDGSVTTHLGQSLQGFTAAGFFQDDWRATRRLTINIGLRYDYQQQPNERWNGSSNFDPFGVDTVSGLLGRTVYAGREGQGRTFRNEDYADWGPRFGFAYDVSGKGKTVLRGGYAIFYPTIWYTFNYGATSGFASTTTNYTPPGGNSNVPAFQLKNGLPFPAIQPQGAALGPSAFLGQSVTWDETSGQTARSQQWTISLQHELRGNWKVEANYAGNLGSHFSPAGYEYNQLDPKYMPLGQQLLNQVPNPYAGRVPGSLGGATISSLQALKPYPYYTSITVRSPHATGYNSHALILSAEKRMSKGLSLLFSYTGGKILSEGINTPISFGAVEQTNVYGYQSGKFNRHVERSVDPLDISQRAVASALYELPFGKGKPWASGSRAVNSIIGGWQLNVVGTMQTGPPVVVRGASGPGGFADRPDSTGRGAAISNPSAQRWFDTTQFVNPANFTFGNLGRVLPDVRNPGTNNWDFSAIKNTSITERFTLQFRFESFNVLNHVNLRLANGNFSPGADGKNNSGSFGVITSSRDARNQQVGLKLIF